MTVINREYFARKRKKTEMCHKERLIENFGPIARMGVELELQEDKTALYWNDSSFTLIEDFKKWNLVVSCSSMSARSLVSLLEKKIKFDVLTLEGDLVRCDFTPTLRGIVSIAVIEESKVIEVERKVDAVLESLHIDVLRRRRFDETGAEYSKRMHYLNKLIQPVDGLEKIAYEWRTVTYLDYSGVDTSSKNYNLEDGLIG